MNKILIITYYWPPAAGPGVQRFLKTSKYLSRFNWRPYIITVRNGTYSSTDESLCNDIPDSVKEYKTKTWEPFKIYEAITGKKGSSGSVGMINISSSKSILQKLSLYIRANLFIPDSRKYWVKYAFKEASRIIKKEDVKIVITTGPPHSTHFTGLKLKEKFNIKWIADFRDPWTNVYYNKSLPRTKRTKIKDKKLEDKIVKRADLLTVVSNGLKEEFYNRNKNIEVIHNGFDNDDIEIKPVQAKKEKFIISYIGNFKPNQNIENLWFAIKELKSNNKTFSDKLEISLTGNADNSIIKSIENNGLTENLQLNGYVSHKEATELMTESDILLFIIPETENNNLIITGKLFEYIACRTPILSIGPTKGDAAQIINNSGRDKMIDYFDNKNIKAFVEKYFEIWVKEKNRFKHKDESFMKYSRENLTKKLINAINKII